MMNIPHVFTSLKNRLQAILLTVLTLLMPDNLLAQEPYAVLSDENTVLTFYYDDQMTARGGMSVGPFVQSFNQEQQRYIVNSGWDEQRENITNVVFDASFANCTTLTSTAYWFYDFDHLTTVTGINYLHTDNVTSMRSMFQDCSSLTNIDLSNFNTQNVTDMYQMFCFCSALTSLDVSGFNTENVTNMSGMFTACRTLTSLDVRNFNTQNVTDMTWMFQSCSGLSSLDVSGFNTAKVTSTHGMFRLCSGLISLDLSNFNVENVEEMRYMFEDCTSLTSIDLSSFNTQHAIYMTSMFHGCSNLTSIDISGFNTANVTDFGNMFVNCSSLAAIVAGNANIPAEQYAQIGNPNLLVYVNDASLAPKGVQNVVINGTAPEIILTDVESGNNNWYCPQPFTAQKISYTRNFQQQTQIGVSRGWETIALPFDVQTIAAEDSRIITPFGDYTSPYNFWLRRLTHNGLQSAQQIEANTPYLISMPNSTEYPEEYKLAGKVTFSAENASVPESNLVIDESADIFFAPSFERMEAQQYIYAINVGEERGGHPEGSVFEQNYREVRPFEAYTKHLTGPSRFITLDDLDEGFATSIEELKDGRSEGLKSESWYDLNGRRVLRPSKGVFIRNGKQVIFK
ncbi:MAG: BspA family leucine-rich repeat surface protein [Prevotella sp.]|nr:BspA family leucine-rich repeat surface protein [Prevotella sp.]